MNRFLDTVVVCPLTTKLHPRWRSRVQTACAGRKAEIAADQIRTISKERLGRRLDELEPATAMMLRRLITEMGQSGSAGPHPAGRHHVTPRIQASTWADAWRRLTS
jgi:hypothetical protein